MRLREIATHFYKIGKISRQFPNDAYRKPLSYNFQDEKIATVTIPAVAAGGVIGATFWLNTIRPPPAGLGGCGWCWLVVTAGLGGLLTADSW